MKRDFINNLLKGKLTEETDEKAIIDAIIDENSVDIGKAKGDSENLKEHVEDLTQQLSDRDSQLEKLKGVDVDKLNGEIERLQEENKAAKEEREKAIAQIKLESGIREALHTANAKNVDKVMKLLDMGTISLDKDGKVTGIEEQIKSLTEDELTKSWFGSQSPIPSGAEPTPGVGNPTQKKLSEMSYAELDAYMKANPDVDISTME